MDGTIVEVGYGLAAVAFFTLFVLTGLSKIQSRQRLILLIVAAVNFVWALAIAYSAFIALPAWFLLTVEVGRIAIWLVFTVELLGLLRQSATELRLLKFLGVALPAAVATYVMTQPALESLAGINWLPSGRALWMLIPVAGLLLLENLFRNADRDSRWATKHLCLAIGIIYAYDFFYFADAMFLGRPNPTLYGVRGFVSAMMVPLIILGVVRSHAWPVAIHVSRRVVFHSFALVGSGLYLLLMGAAGFYFRRIEGEWGSTLQIVFLIGAASILAVIFNSGSLRARARLFISRNFFSLKYDYRETWMHFVRTLSSGNPELGLQRRLLDAVSELMESTAGGLWVRSPEEASYVPGVSWNLGEGLPAEPLGSPFADWFGQQEEVVELAEAADMKRYPNLQVPDWLRTLPRAWLVVPLVHRTKLQGFMVLGKPRTNRDLDWEDYELLHAIGRQAASYLAEEQSANALSDARQLQLFSRRFAFVAHDLKNIVGQLSLLVRNAERFKDNAQFRDDMVETIAHSVDHMSALLQQLRSMADDDTSSTTEPVALDTLLAETAATWQRQRPGFSADLKSTRGLLRVPTERLRSVLDHLVQNAFDAAGSEGRVALRARRMDNSAVIEVEDDGPGMDIDFVSQKLFRPFRSTRSTGFGIGAYQIREYVRSMGGRLEVQTAPGMGTTMQVLLPLLPSDNEVTSALPLEAVGS
jgi:putative PEP-CTERM system histidine kinase